MSRTDLWTDHARQYWTFGSPLRPSAEDLAAYAAALRACAVPDGVTSLVMGVTPDLTALASRSGRVVAIDRSIAMIRALRVSGRDGAPGAAACGDWRALPVADACADLILGDGMLSTLRFPDEYLLAGAEMTRVLRPSGLVAVRCYMRPDRRETLDVIRERVAAGMVGSVHALKWRIAMALHADSREGIAVRDVWDVVARWWPDLDALSGETGWPRDTVRMLLAYRDDCVTRYTFPTAGEYADAFEAMRLTVVDRFQPGYELGDRCPTLILRPSSRA